MSEERKKIVRLVADQLDPAIDLKARRYLSTHCWLIPVNDEAAIMRHARELYRIGVSRDWTRDQLRMMCDHWPWSPVSKEVLVRGVARAYQIEERLQIPSIGKADISPTPWRPVQIPQRSWLYRPMYIRKFVSLTAATGGTGKTSLGLVENAAMVTGKPLLGITPGEEELCCWYWNGEDPDDEMQRRFAAVIKQFGLKPEEFDGRWFMDSGREMPIKIAALEDGKSVVSEPLVADLIYMIQHHGIDVLNIDPFVSCHSVTENDTAAIQMVAEQFAHIANETNCSIHLWHHTRKTRGADATIEDSRGASALIGAARGRRVLNKMTETEAKTANLPPEERGYYFWADCSLSSMAPPAEARQWFKLESINLGNGECGDGDEVGVAVAWEYTGKALALDDEQEELVLAAIRNGGPWRASAKAEDWIGVPIAKTLGLNLESKLHRKLLTKLIEVWLGSGRLEKLQGLDKKRMKKEYVRATESEVHRTTDNDEDGL